MIRPNFVHIAPCAWPLKHGIRCGGLPSAYDPDGRRFLCAQHAAQAACEAALDDGAAAIAEALRILREAQQA